MQNIYTVLDKIRFDERVNEEIRILKQCENTDSFNAILSDFVFKNFCFGLIRDFYDEILKENVANNVSKPNSQHSEPNCNIMLKNPEDFNTSDENVKENNR